MVLETKDPESLIFILPVLSKFNILVALCLKIKSLLLTKDEILNLLLVPKTNYCLLLAAELDIIKDEELLLPVIFN